MGYLAGKLSNLSQIDYPQLFPIKLYLFSNKGKKLQLSLKLVLTVIHFSFHSRN